MTKHLKILVSGLYMILTKEEILKEIAAGNIVIKPFSKKHLGPASLDITLSNEFCAFPTGHRITLSEKTDVEKFTKWYKARQQILKPGDFLLGKTIEKITLPTNVCGFISGRSRFARIGLSIDVTAFLIPPGVSNHQVFEIKNQFNHTVILKPGLRIAQIVFMQTKGEAKCTGKFDKQ